MNINASIIDQQLTGILEKHADWFPRPDESRNRSVAFVLLSMSRFLDLPLHEVRDLLTEGGNDAGVDGLHIGEVDDGEFLVTLFQAKYKQNLNGTDNFPENAVEKAVGTVQVLFDPLREVTMNDRLAPRVEEVRSLIRDGYIPKVRFVLCNNGQSWVPGAQVRIEELEKSHPGRLDFQHFNHDAIVGILQRTKRVDASLRLSGQLIVEDMNFMRVMVGRVAVQQLAELYERHGDALLQRNIRRYLGLHSNRVNSEIRETLLSASAEKFYFYNNGITIVCDKFEHNGFQRIDHTVQLKNMQIINGGQTCRTIYEALQGTPSSALPESAYVMIRVYQLAEENKDFVHDITYATNSQNPVDLRDLRSNDDFQKRLEIGMRDLGYTYKRQREDGGGGSNVITSASVAEATLAIWRRKPHQAKFLRREHFGKLYDEIFHDLNAAQAILAVLIFREVENERKRPTSSSPPAFLPYASHYLSMLIGIQIRMTNGTRLREFSRMDYSTKSAELQQSFKYYYANAVQLVSQALTQLYGGRPVSLQQLSATFRRGDLLDVLFRTVDPQP